jgi:glycyl-tRNA synthetase beta chain
VAIAVALADKLDQLAGFFAVGEKPTGSGDPFALRRAALGVIRIVRENGLRLSILEAVDAARLPLRSDIRHAQSDAEKRSAAPWGPPEDPDLNSWITVRGKPEQVSVTVWSVLQFLLDRLRVQLRAEGTRHDVLTAILGAAPDDDLNRLLRRADSVRAFVESDAGANLLAAYKRTANILRIEEKRDGHTYDPGYEHHLLKAPEEEALATALEAAAARIALDLDAEDFERAMDVMATLRAPVDAFFDKVIVNDAAPELRRNRLKLLARLRATMDAVADFSKIEA